MVVPKEEIDYIFDLPTDKLQALMAFSKDVAKRLKAEIACKKIGMTVIGLEVAHAHIHLVPINTIEDMNFSRSKLILSDDSANELVKKLKKNN